MIPYCSHLQDVTCFSSTEGGGLLCANVYVLLCTVIFSNVLQFIVECCLSVSSQLSVNNVLQNVNTDMVAD